MNAPVFSAHWTSPRAARSFTEPPGFMNSALPRISQPVSSLSELMRICAEVRSVSRGGGGGEERGRRGTDERGVADCADEAVYGERVRVRLERGLRVGGRRVVGSRRGRGAQEGGCAEGGTGGEGRAEERHGCGWVRLCERAGV